MLYKKTKEITQYIPNINDNLINKEIYVYNDKIYVLQQQRENNYYRKIIVTIFGFFEGLVEKIQEYYMEKLINENNDMKIMVINENNIYIFGEYIYRINN